MNNLTLRQLRYFEAVASHGHFGRAAQASGVTQPALSAQIKDLETSTGFALFERTSRHVRLTPLGEDFATRAREILAAVDGLNESVDMMRSGAATRLRLGIIPTIAPYLLPSAIRLLSHGYPGMNIQVRETVTQSLLEQLADGRLDAAILALPVSQPTLEKVPLFDEAFVLVRPLSDVAKPTPSPQHLSEMRLFLLEEGHCFRDQALSFCGLPSALPREGLDGCTLSTLVQMVGLEMGVTLIPEMAVPIETRSAPVTIARFAPPEPSRTVGMVWRKTTPLAPQLREIANLVQQAASAAHETIKT
ncbi:MAG: LysR substrate-binding domain-containing protein [Pseudomonadota bacterium]